MRIMFAGDVHGNATFCQYLAQTAQRLEVDRIVQVGDFGYLEHDHEGVQFCNHIEKFAARTGVKWVFVDGNHDNVGLLRRKYSVADEEGFVTVRPGLSYAPRGHRWTWDGVRFAAFGGAYSVDKDWRLEQERVAQKKLDRSNFYRRAAGRPELSAAGTWWFPEEEATDAELADFVADKSPVDVLVTHDKPRAASPKRNRKTMPECLANQDRIQEACRVLTPKLLVHGHLHTRYTDWIRVSGEHWTRVDGLGADPQTRNDDPAWARENAWLIVDGAEGLEALLDPAVG